VQAVCDSLVFNSSDSCMTMYKDPIVWNGNRQLLGEEIKAYMNDSTIRFAHVIGQALSVELMEDGEHYNQISSKEMMAYFEEGKIRRSDAVGNVVSIFYPIDEKDSTLTGLNYAETDTMRIFFTPERKLQKIWTSKVQSTMYPMSQIPPTKSKLRSFGWFDDIRPKYPLDVFNWKGKGSGSNLVIIKRQQAPIQKLKNTKSEAASAVMETSEAAEKSEENGVEATENAEETKE